VQRIGRFLMPILCRKALIASAHTVVSDECHSSGVRKSRRFRGRVLSLWAMTLHSCWGECSHAGALGRYCAIGVYIGAAVPGVMGRGEKAPHAPLHSAVTALAAGPATAATAAPAKPAPAAEPLHRAASRYASPPCAWPASMLHCHSAARSVR